MFVLSELSGDMRDISSNRCVFFVRSEILTFHNISEDELPIEVCEEAQGISFTSLPERNEEVSISTPTPAAPTPSQQGNNHAGQQKFKQHRTDNTYTKNRYQRRNEGNDEGNEEKSDQDQTPKVVYEMYVV